MKFGRVVENNHGNNNIKEFLRNIKNLKRDLGLKLENTLDTSMLLVCVCVWPGAKITRSDDLDTSRSDHLKLLPHFFPHFLQTSKLDFQKLIRILKSNWSSNLEPKARLFKQRALKIPPILVEFCFKAT